MTGSRTARLRRVGRRQARKPAHKGQVARLRTRDRSYAYAQGTGRTHTLRTSPGKNSFGSVRFWLPARLDVGGLGGMGAKYLPTIKDLKANLRFQQKQTALLKSRKSLGAAPAKPGKKK